MVLIDNCEHVIDAIAHLTGRTLEAAPDVRVLATSREPLGLSGEVIWSIPGMVIA
jgi:predicted ATPase